MGHKSVQNRNGSQVHTAVTVTYSGESHADISEDHIASIFTFGLLASEELMFLTNVH